MNNQHIVTFNYPKRAINIMKIILIMMVAGLTQAVAVTYAQTTILSVQVKNETLESVFKRIEKESEFLFFYNVDEIDKNEKISLDKKNSPIDEILQEIFEKTGITYSIKDRHIVLTSSPGTKVQDTPQTNKTISGIIRDDRGETIIGANVVEKGTTNGVITDMDGHFTLSVSENSTLQISYIGYLMQEVPVRNQTNFQITLREDIQSLDEVVVIGYGTVKKKDVTGAVSQVRSEEILKTNSPTLATALQGQIPVDVGGVWKPGSNPSIEIRGVSSITGSNDPLWVVDGIPMQSSSVSLNPNDVESIDILKDASASAIYGARGSNGVIIVTTKRAVAGQNSIKASYSGWVGFEQLSRRPDLMNGDEHVAYRRLAVQNAGRDTSDEAMFDAVELATLQSRNYTDWFDLVWGGTAFSTNHNFTLNASSQKTATMLSLSYLDQGSLIETAGYKRFNVNFNNTFEFSERLKFTTAILGSYSKTENFHAYVRHAYYLSPLVTPYDEEGNVKLYSNPNENLITNPLAEIENNRNSTTLYGFIGSLSMDWRIWDELRYKFSAGIDFSTDDNGKYEGSETRERSEGPHAASYESRKRLSSIVDNVLSYNKVVNNHRIGVMAAYNIETYQSKSVYLKGTDMFFDGLFYNLESAATVLGKNTKLSEWGIMSYMGRINYSFLERYLLTLTYRRDGSSRLSDKNKWAGFPSVSVAWRLSEEPFMLSFNQKFLDNLKLRLSWGNTGNTNADPYGTLGKLSTTYYSWDETPAMGIIPTGIPNPDLKWEKTEEYNIGLDFGLFHSRLNGAVDWYRRTTKDLILSRNLPATSGYTSITQNIGSTRNQGIEISLNGDLIRKKDLRWNMGITFFKNKNQILDLFGDKKDDVGSKHFIGYPIRVQYLLDFIGVWQENEAEQAAVCNAEPGYPKYWDIYNKEGEAPGINLNDDRYIINTDPSWIGGLNTTVVYKDFDLYISMNTRQGEKQWSDVHAIDNIERYISFRQNYWTPENKSNTDPAPAVANTYTDFTNSDYYIHDVSFVRLSNISLGYTLPSNVAKKFGMERAKVYVNISNPCVWSSYKGQDPQVTHRESYPAVTSYQFGINLNF